MGSFSFCVKTIRLVHPWGYSSSVDRWQTLALSPRLPALATGVSPQQRHSPAAVLQMNEKHPKSNQEVKLVTAGAQLSFVLHFLCLQQWSVPQRVCTDSGIVRIKRNQPCVNTHSFKDRLTRTNSSEGQICTFGASGCNNVIKMTICWFVYILLTMMHCFHIRQIQY